jgi:hypothetical protein
MGADPDDQAELLWNWESPESRQEFTQKNMRQDWHSKHVLDKSAIAFLKRLLFRSILISFISNP